MVALSGLPFVVKMCMCNCEHSYYDNFTSRSFAKFLAACEGTLEARNGDKNCPFPYIILYVALVVFHCKRLTVLGLRFAIIHSQLRVRAACTYVRMRIIIIV